MSKFAMVPRKVAEFHEDFNTITLDLLKNIQQRRNLETNVVSDTADLLFKWSFECEFHRLRIRIISVLFLVRQNSTPLHLMQFIALINVSMV